MMRRVEDWCRGLNVHSWPRLSPPDWSIMTTLPEEEQDPSKSGNYITGFPLPAVSEAQIRPYHTFPILILVGIRALKYYSSDSTYRSRSVGLNTSIALVAHGTQFYAHFDRYLSGSYASCWGYIVIGLLPAKRIPYRHPTPAPAFPQQPTTPT